MSEPHEIDRLLDDGCPHVEAHQADRAFDSEGALYCAFPEIWDDGPRTLLERELDHWDEPEEW